MNAKKRARKSSAPRHHTGKWLNGKNYEYEFAYCSECGRTLWAGWDSHREAKENIRDFAEYYRYCPGCGVKMEGGKYVE